MTKFLDRLAKVIVGVFVLGFVAFLVGLVIVVPEVRAAFLAVGFCAVVVFILLWAVLRLDDKERQK